MRVCETCYEKLAKKELQAAAAEAAGAVAATKTADKQETVPKTTENARSGETTTVLRAREAESKAREDEEVQLAMAISQSEEDEKERRRMARRRAI